MMTSIHPILILQEGERPAISFSDGPAGPSSGTATTGEATTQGSPATEGGLGGDAAQESGSSNGFWIMLALLFAFMWFFVIRPENKRQRKRKEFQTALKKGDDVVTAGGLHGVIAAIDEQTVTLKVADNVRMKFDRVAVSRNASAAAEAEPPAKK